jgi:hypothetical protein
MSVLSPQAYPTLSSQPAYTYAQVKRADEARLAGSKRSKNQGPCQAQDWSLKRKEDISSWEDFLGTAYNEAKHLFTATRLMVFMHLGMNHH